MKSILLFCLLLGMVSCSSNDGEINTVDNEPFEFPLKTGNNWTYDVENDDNTSGRDMLYVANDIVISGNTYKKMMVENNVATGFYSTSLKDNGVRLDGNKILLTGDLSLGAGQGSPINLDLNLLDFIVFDANTPISEITTVKTGTFQQTVSGYPLTISYVLKSVRGDNFASFNSPNGDTYTNVKSGKIILSATITTTLSGFPIVFLPEQNILVSEQFYAKNIGVVHTKTVTGYTLNPAIPEPVITQLGIPTTDNAVQNEFLDTYLIN